MQPWNGRAEPLMSLIVLLAAALSAVPWIAAKASLRTKVVETLNRIDQLESTGDTSSSGSVADRLCAIAALLSTADTDPLQQAHLVQLLLNSCGAHTAGAADAGPAVSSAGPQEALLAKAHAHVAQPSGCGGCATGWPPLEDARRVGHVMVWFGGREAGSRGGVAAAAAAVDHACSRALQRDALHHHGVVVSAIGGFLHGAIPPSRIHVVGSRAGHTRESQPRSTAMQKFANRNVGVWRGR
jgi:hypothetical protein